MVFFKNWKAVVAPHTALRVSTREPEPCGLGPGEVRAEHGTAYLHLLSQLAKCGIDAAGPPLLQDRGRL